MVLFADLSGSYDYIVPHRESNSAQAVTVVVKEVNYEVRSVTVWLSSGSEIPREDCAGQASLGPGQEDVGLGKDALSDG